MHFTIADGSGSFLNVVPCGVSKEAALAVLLPDVLPGGGPWRGMLAFGDDLSGLEVLRAAEYGVAMANAHPQVLAAAAHRTHSNAQDGVAYAIERLIEQCG